MFSVDNGTVEASWEGQQVAWRIEEMKRIAKVALLVVLLIGGMVQAGWCQGNVDQYVIELNSKAAAAFKKGDLQQGVIIAEQAYRYATEYLGAKHPYTLSSINNLAALYYALGDSRKAEPLLKQALQLMKNELGPEHPDTLNAISNLAELYRAQGRYGEAEPLCKEALQLKKKALGQEHPNTLTAINNLAALYYTQGRYNSTIKFFLLD